MFIQPDFNFVFIAVPKTGCTSVAHALSLNLDQPIREYHATVKDVMERNEDFKHYFKFGFVRNPWDRMVSIYCESVTAYQKFNTFAHPTFSEIILEEFESFNDSVLRHRDFGLHEKTHFLPCSHFLTIDNDIAVDFVGRFENLEGDYINVCGKMGWNLAPRLYHSRKSNRSSDYKIYYTKESSELISKIYEEDIERFNYVF